MILIIHVIFNVDSFRFWRLIYLHVAAVGRLRAQDGIAALSFAARKGSVDCARLLLDSGADKHAKSNVRRVSCVVVIQLLPCLLVCDLFVMSFSF